MRLPTSVLEKNTKQKAWGRKTPCQKYLYCEYQPRWRLKEKKRPKHGRGRSGRWCNRRLKLEGTDTDQLSHLIDGGSQSTGEKSHRERQPGPPILSAWRYWSVRKRYANENYTERGGIELRLQQMPPFVPRSTAFFIFTTVENHEQSWTIITYCGGEEVPGCSRWIMGEEPTLGMLPLQFNMVAFSPTRTTDQPLV